MPKSGRTGKRPDYMSVESWKETKSVDHEAQSMNGGGRSMFHSEKRGAGVESMSLSLRNQRVQNNEMYLVGDIDTKLLQLRNPRECPSQLLQRRLRTKSLDELRLRLKQLRDQRHR
jgi:hypothetical protein